VGAQSKIIELWHHYFAGSDAIIYVIDSADIERISYAKKIFEGVVHHKDMPLCPILVFANKIDLAQMTPD
jgi:signal recognition particle receptor subunit beta